MPNPLQTAWQYLRGQDLKSVPAPTGVNLAVPTPSSPSGYAWLEQPGMQGVFSSDRQLGLDGNSAVFACLMALGYAHIEPPLRVMRQTDPDADPEWIAGSPLQALLSDPNPWHDGLELWFWAQYARHCDGNAYLRKVRSGNELTGNVIELWPISPRLMSPVTLDGSSNFIDHYEYRYAPGKREKVPTENVIHFRIGIDDHDHRLGLAPIKRLIREIASDEEATRFADALLSNYGIPGLVVQVPQDTPISEEQALSLKERMRTAFGSDNRGNVGILTGGADMKQFGFSPNDLNLEALHNVPETRIAAVMGVPPAVAGLGVGLAQTSNFASLKQVRENFTEVTLIPTWRLDSAKLNKQLKPDFTPERTISITYDLSKVRALQEDMDAQYRRLDLGVRSFWIRPGEARVAVGLPADPELDTLWLERATSAPAAGAFGNPPAVTAGRTAVEMKRLDSATLDDYPELVQTMIDAAAPRLQAQLERHFDDTRKRVKRALLEQRVTQALAVKDAGDDLDAVWPSDDERRRLEDIIGPYYQATLEAINTILANLFGQDVDPTSMIVSDAAVARILAEAATRVVRIDDATRSAVRAQLQLGQLRGYSTWQIAHGVPSDGYRGIDGLFQETWAGRADTIARTELQHASVVASIDRYVATGLVDRVRIIDGDDWDPTCANRNGQVVPIEQAPSLAHPNCLVSGQVVWAPNRQAGSTRWFDGEVVILRTAAGDLLTVTPNHPVLTLAGWQFARDVRHGECVVRCKDAQRVSALVDPDHEHRPALIEQIANAPGPTSHRTAATMPLSTEAFHGEATAGDICVVWADRSAKLRNRQLFREPAIGIADVTARALSAERFPTEIIPGFRYATDGRVRRGGVGETFFVGHPLIPKSHRFAHRTRQLIVSEPDRDSRRVNCESRSDLHNAHLLVDVQTAEHGDTGVASARRSIAGLSQIAMDRGRANTNAARDLFQRFPGLMSSVEIVEIERRNFAGHVYNLQTSQGWYIASNLIAHNCTLVLVPLLRE